MIGTVHLLVGAALGKTLQNPYLTILISFTTHYLLDAIPHCQMTAVKGFKEFGLRGCDKKDLALKSIEPILSIIVTLLVMDLNRPDAWPIFLGAFFGLLPDLLGFVEWKFNTRVRPPFVPTFEQRFHRHIGLIGIFPQILLMAFALIYLLF